MATVERFEDLEVWQEARLLVRDIYEMTTQGAWSRDFGMRDQIRRASVSVMSNVAEGFERGSDREFARFLKIAKASAGEVRSLMYVARDVAYLSEGSFVALSQRIEKVSRKIARLLGYLQRSTGDTRNKGPKGP